MKTIKDAENFAQQFLDREMEEFEVYLATTEDKIVHHHGYDGLSDGLDVHRDVLIDGIRFEEYGNITKELDKFIIDNDKSIDKNTVMYQVLSRKFLAAKIESLSKQIKMCEGHDYSYVSSTLRDLTVPIEEFSKSSARISKSISKWSRKATQLRQERINKTAKQIMQDYPKSTKESLAEDVFSKLKKDDDKLPKSATILKDYLDNYPNF